jgi:lipoprotein-anchoring transpeptidase ErfK/SrfK
MLWKSKLSDMEDEKIINEGEQPEIVKHTGENNIEKNGSTDQTASTFWQKFRARKVLFNIVRFVFILLGSILVTISLILFILYAVPVLKELSPLKKTDISNNQSLKKDPSYNKQLGLLSKDIQRLSLKVNGYTSGQSYIVINTIENRFSLYTNKKLIREGFCSSGSYMMLQTSGNKKWVFKTPKGKYWIHGKTTNPVWKRPDWSFVEEGSPIPSANADSRYEYGVLGDYALTLGDGYMIHGTIYKRFLGMPVTHGCVRLNDEDLKVIFNTLNIGSKVYIF